MTCPKCNGQMREYTRKNGERWVMCLNRRNCNLHLPLAAMPDQEPGFAGVREEVLSE